MVRLSKVILTVTKPVISYVLTVGTCGLVEYIIQVHTCICKPKIIFQKKPALPCRVSSPEVLERQMMEKSVNPEVLHLVQQLSSPRLSLHQGICSFFVLSGRTLSMHEEQLLDSLSVH